MDASAYNDWKLIGLSPLPMWAVLLLGGGILAGLAFSAWGLWREPSRRRRFLLIGLRGLAALCAIFFLLEPGFRRLQISKAKGRLAVLVDRSASMGFAAERGGNPRSEEVARYLESVAPALAELGQQYSVEYFGFDGDLAPLSLQALRAQEAKGGRTDILASLSALRAEESSGGKKWSGALLFSDGADNGELAAGGAARARKLLGDWGVPVSTFVVGKEGLADLAVERVRVDDFAFVRNSVSVDVDIRGRGFAGQQIPVVLRREGQLVATKTVQFKERDEHVPVSFQFTPDQTGRYVYTVEVPVYPDEAVADNNSRSFVLKVIRDRVRVLFVVGRPTWDERFLRGLLHQDPNVDLVSFYILRTLGDDPNVRNQERELSLIPFPMDEIFQAKLDTFDIVIFQNFGYTDPQLSIAMYERNLERYVSNGGGLLVIGGDRSFGEGRAGFHILGQALPVESVGMAASQESFKPRLTPEGQRHPITSIAPGASANEAGWNGLPPVPGSNLTRAKPGATVLLDHPLERPGGVSAPVLAIWDYGQGRSAALTIDSSWYWSFTSSRTGSPTRIYDRFWGNLLRWLVRDPELTQVRVTADPAAVDPGKPVAAVVSARNAAYEPAAGAQVTLELWSMKDKSRVATLSAAAGADGTVRLEFPPPPAGAYKLLAKASLAEKPLGEAEDAVAVRSVGSELSDASVRPEWLAQLAQVTGGKPYQLPSSGLPDFPKQPLPVVEVGRSKDEPLWDRWYYLAALAFFLAAEWVLRRRFGYI